MSLKSSLLSVDISDYKIIVQPSAHTEKTSSGKMLPISHLIKWNIS